MSYSILKNGFRFRAQFNVHPEVDLKFQVPKMCIHTYVENAIKHGFRNTIKDGNLDITILPYKSGVSISISDNGMGREAASKCKDSSGKGLNIMKEFYQLFEKYHNYKIDCNILDLSDSKMSTKVELKILKV